MTSFVIPHRGRLAMLDDTIRSIAEQTLFSSVLEIIIVTADADLELNCLSVSRDSNIKSRLLLLRADQSATIAAMRNQGADCAGGEYLAFLDADIRLEHNWLENFLHMHKTYPGAAVFAAVQQPDEQRSLLHRVRSRLSSRSVGSAVDSLPGANLFMPVSVFNGSTRFPEHLVSCEDVAFTASLRVLGELHLTDRTGFIHLGEDKDFRQLFSKEMFRGESSLMSLRDGRGIFAELPSIAAPLMVLSGFALIPVALLARLGIPVLMAAIALLVLQLAAYTYRLVRQRNAVRVSAGEAAAFYFVYFLGRAAGMLRGPFRRLLAGS